MAARWRQVVLGNLLHLDEQLNRGDRRPELHRQLTVDPDLAAVLRILNEMRTVHVSHYDIDGTAVVTISGIETVAADDARVLERLMRRHT